jgi:Lrp/AsnC family transcriptional regulator for asnA, asnC and gidA
MSKQSNVIDDVDKLILKMLLRNGRTPYKRIAEDLGLSEATIYLRIRKLSKLGILRGFTANIDLSRLGLTVIAFMMLKVSPKNYEETLKRIANSPRVLEVYEVSGEYQVLAKVIASDNRELAKIVDGLGSIDGLIEVKVLYVIRTLRTPYEATELITYI